MVSWEYITSEGFWKRLSAEEAEVVRGSHAYGRGREPARVFRFLARLETCRRPLPHNMIKGPTCYVLDTRPGPRRNPLGTPLLRCSFGFSKFDTAQVVSGRFDSIRPRKTFKGGNLFRYSWALVLERSSLAEAAKHLLIVVYPLP